MKTTDVIRKPLITEKTTVLREDGRTLVFQVAMDANKIDIKKAVESLLGSKVESVRTSLAHGKFKRQGKYVGRRSDWKKAYVKLRDGEVIVVDALAVEQVKTKAAAELLQRLGVAGKALLVDVAPQDALTLSVRNLQGVRLKASNRVTARDVVDTRRVVLTQAALEKLQSVLG